MAPRKSPTSEIIYQLKITLEGVKPPIWRRIQVLDTTNLSQLHQIIQAIMPWGGYHLHQFEANQEYYGEIIPGFDDDMSDEKKVKLNQLVEREKFKFRYTYDMGDSWDHLILVEKILPREADKPYPTCLAGKRACPPDDCGGAWGFAEFVEKIQDPKHPEHEETVEWLGRTFDPNQFDLAWTNAQLRQFK